MMENTTKATSAPASIGRLSSPSVDWPSILAGAVLAAGIGLVLNAFGAALGLGTISAEPGEGSFSLWLIVTAVWMVISMLLTYWAGGYVAGRMRRRGDGMTDEEVSVRDGVHGLVVWALGTIAMGWIAISVLASVTTTVSNVAGAAVEGAGSAIATGAEVAGQALAGPDATEAIGAIGARLNRPDLTAATASPGEGTDPAELARQSATILAEVALTGEISDQDRAFLSAVAVRVTGIPPAEAEARTEAAILAAQALRSNAEAAVATAEAEARAAAETARKSAVLTAFLVAAASLVAAAAAVIGGVQGGHQRDENRFFSGLGYRR